MGLLVIWHLLKSKDYSALYKSFHDPLAHKIWKLKTVAEGKKSKMCSHKVCGRGMFFISVSLFIKMQCMLYYTLLYIVFIL